MAMNELIELARRHDAHFIDCRYTELLRGWRHQTIPVRASVADTPVDLSGVADGGVLIPAVDTAVLDPFCQHPTLAVICDVKHSESGADYPRDSRSVARRAETHLQKTGVAERATFELTVEFFIFDQAVYEQGINAARYHLDSREGAWRRGHDQSDNLGTQIPRGDGADQLPPADSLHNLRGEMVAALELFKVQVRRHRRGPATGGHGIIELQPTTLVNAADALMITKSVVRNVAARHGKVATFMPQPLHGEHGCGLPLRLSLAEPRTKAGGDAAADPANSGIDGHLPHAASLLALTCPTTNGYRRLASLAGEIRTDGDERPGSPPTSSIDYPYADSTCDPYLAFSALLMAATDGSAPTPTSPGRQIPQTLEQALAALEADREYLLADGVFTDEILDLWIQHKRAHEAAELARRPHPYEFCLYFNA
jgi:glutamine synthetase